MILYNQKPPTKGELILLSIIFNASPKLRGSIPQCTCIPGDRVLVHFEIDTGEIIDVNFLIPRTMKIKEVKDLQPLILEELMA